MRNLHANYDRLTADERKICDEIIEDAFDRMKAAGVPVAGDDRCEEAVDAIAKWIISSRAGA